MATKYKPNDTIVDANGVTWRRTQGGNWRAMDGPNKDKLFKDVGGKGDPVAGPAPATPQQVGDGGATSKPAPAGAAPIREIFDPNLPLNTAGQVFNTQYDISKVGQAAGNILTNPNQYGPLGSQTVDIDPITFQPIVRQELSEGNQAALSGIQGGSVAASDVLQQLLNSGQLGQFINAAGPQSGYSDPELEEAIYSRLTQGFDDKKAREAEQMSQTLQNRGIPVGSEAYSNAMRDFEQNWGTQYENARLNATQQGTQTALQRQQNNIGALGQLTGTSGTLAGIGQGGFYAPQFNPFSSVQYNQANVSDVFNSLLGAQLAREGFQTDIQTANIAAKNKGSSVSVPASSSSSSLPFGGKPPGS